MAKTIYINWHGRPSIRVSVWWKIYAHSLLQYVHPHINKCLLFFFDSPASSLSFFIAAQTYKGSNTPVESNQSSRLLSHLQKPRHHQPRTSSPTKRPSMRPLTCCRGITAGIRGGGGPVIGMYAIGRPCTMGGRPGPGYDILPLQRRSPSRPIDSAVCACGLRRVVTRGPRGFPCAECGRAKRKCREWQNYGAADVVSCLNCWRTRSDALRRTPQ